ncbi:MAG TPA: phage major capsid protein [Candidatus Gemmiger faecavium]|nr:phage major capsid protein [Candidatus Gemmiger faecavium]
MALKSIVLRHKIDKMRKELEDLRAKDKDFDTREAELVEAVKQASSEEDQKIVEEEAEKFDAEKSDHEKEKSRLSGEIERLETELKESEKAPEAQPEAPGNEGEERSKEMYDTRKKFFGMNMQERTAFVQREDVQSFLQRVRQLGQSDEKRSVTGAELTIPVVVLDLIRQNIMDYSKLVRHVRLRPVNGKARQSVMGQIPEAVWTEACASLSELSFAINQVEMDGYKVGGIIYICKASLEDSDLNLAAEIIEMLGASIGIALDKAILYGTGIKMPLGVVPRLEQTAQPSDYPATARPWENLKSTNVINLGDKHGLELFQAIGKAAAAMKGKYSRGEKFWAMNETTYNTLMVEAMSINSAGAIVSGMNGTMPVLGGIVEVLSDDIIADNNIVAGYGDLYLLVERAGSTFERSDEYRFADDQIAFKGTARYDGEPIIAEGFVVMAINSEPQASATFPGDTANDASLAALTIGSETLSPTFDPNKTAYTIAAASAASDIVTASPTQAKAEVTIAYQGKNYPNGATIKWAADSSAHDLTITVTKGVSVKTYTVSVTKSA